VSTADLRQLAKENRDKTDADRPARGVVRSVHPETESFKVEVYGDTGTKLISLRHPFMAKNSWIRGMPETGTPVVTQTIRQPQQQEMWGYLSHQLGGLVKLGKDDNSGYIFRELRPGEIEIMSVGRAYTHWSEEGEITLSGGVVSLHLTQKELEATSRAPTHKRQLDQHDPVQLAHEERFGLVKRSDTAKPYALQVYVKDSANAYQYEYGRWLCDDAGDDLISLHEGHLYDESGNEIKNSQTNRRTRLQRVIHHVKAGQIDFDVDEDLNILLTNTSQAKTTDLDFGAKNEIKISSKKLDFSITKSSNQVFSKSLTIRSPKVRVNSSDVGFGASPSESAVLGNRMVNSVLTPLLTTLGTALTALGNETALKPPAGAGPTYAAAGSAITTLLSMLQMILSQQVKLTS